MIVRGMGDVLQGDAALASILGASAPGSGPKKSDSVDSSGLPVGAAAGATSVIEIAAVAAVALAVLLALRLFR